MKAIVILSDGVYSIPRSKVSLLELIRHNCHTSNSVSFRYIKGRNCSDLAVSLTDQIEDLYSLRKRSESGTAYVLCGLEECSEGYSIPLFTSHIDGIISELNKINYDVTFINCEIKNGLPGKIGGWFRRCTEIISEASLDGKCTEIKPQIVLKIQQDQAVIDVEATRDIVSEICYHIEGEEDSEEF